MRRTLLLAALLPCALAFLPSLNLPAALGAGPAPAPPAAPLPPDPASAEYFEKNIRPLLEAKCLTCHNASTGVTRGGLALDSQAGWAKGGASGPVIMPGKPDTSTLYKAVSYTDPDLQMPPSGKLSDDQITLIKRWIAMGAPDTRMAAGGEHKLSGLTPKAREHWSFQPLTEPTVPHLKDPTGWIKNPIDAFVLANLQSHGMHPNPRASREVLIRRATYDLTGLPPTVDEVRSFLSDRSPDAWEKVVDRLLASPHYGERWGRHWLDSARYSDTHGINNGGLEDYRFAYAWTYRDYVVKAFNDDKPYNQFLMEQIAADKFPGIQPNDPRLAALGFLTVGKHFDNPDDLIDERIDTVTKATMGLTVSCARCHDHKFDPVPTADYYSLYGIFSNTIEPVDGPELANTFDPAQRADYDAKLKDLETQNQKIYYTWANDKLNAFEKNAEGYLLAGTLPNRSAQQYDVLKQYNLVPVDVEIVNAVRPRGDDPVLGPYARIARIPADQFTTKALPILNRLIKDPKSNVNQLVRNALADLNPTSLKDVAHAYGVLFAQANQQAAAFIQARQSGAPDPANLSPAMTQILTTPYPIPPAAQFTDAGQQMALLRTVSFQPGMQGQFVFPAINDLQMTHPGSPGCAMVVTDAPKMQDAYIHIRGDRNRRGPVVPRRFLEIASGSSNRPTFTEDSGRLELARDIIDPRNPLTARTFINRLWMYHFGEGFVRTPDDLGNQSEPPSNQKLLDWMSSRFMQTGWSIKRMHRAIMLSSTYQESSDTNPEYARRDPEDRLLWRASVRRLDFEAIRDSMVMLTGHMDSTIGGKPVNITDEPYSYRRSVYGYVDRNNLSDLMRQFDFSDPNMPNTERSSTIVPQQALFFMNSPMAVQVAREVLDRPEVTQAPDDAARVKAIYLALFQRSPRPEEVKIAEDFVADAAKDMPPTPPTPQRRTAPRPIPPSGSRSGGGGGTMEMSGDSMSSMSTMSSSNTMASMNTMSSMNSMSGSDSMTMESKRAPKAGKGKPQAQSMMMSSDRAAHDKYAPIQNTGLSVARTSLTPWQLYTQGLLWSNEFVYVR